MANLFSLKYKILVKINVKNTEKETLIAIKSAFFLPNKLFT